MAGKFNTIMIIIVCLIIGIFTGYFAEELFEGEDDDGKSYSGTDSPYQPLIEPDDFVSGIDNAYLPYTPGTKMVYEGKSDDETERTEIIVLNETKQILGITCTVVRDTVYVDGEMAEDTYDWFAQDKIGNVWYFGEDSREYEDGEMVSTGGSWESGVDGAQPGIVMFANPLAGVSYRQEYYKGEAEDMAEIVGLSESKTVAYGSFDNVLKTKEWTPLEPDVVEYKYYAMGIGVIYEEAQSGEDFSELIDFEK